MITLFLGGASSGKSAMAERCAAARDEPVTYVATWVAPPAGDPTMAERVARHRARRPSTWSLRELEPGDSLPAVLSELEGLVLVDALGPWVAGAPAFAPAVDVPGFAVDGAGLAASLTGRRGPSIVVSDEVGLGVHPSTPAGRHFREALGQVNEAVATVATEVWLVVAGRAVALPPGPW